MEEERLPTLQDFLNNERLRTLYQVYFLKPLILKNQNVKSNIKHIIPRVAISDRKSSLLIFTYIYKLYMFIQYWAVFQCSRSPKHFKKWFKQDNFYRTQRFRWFSQKSRTTRPPFTSITIKAKSKKFSSWFRPSLIAISQTWYKQTIYNTIRFCSSFFFTF